MLTRQEARIKLEVTFPGVKAKVWALFNELYLFRVEYPSPLEKDWDPFFSVDPLTGEVRDFSVLTDLSPTEFRDLEWHDI